jgi:hypothetical protein
VLLPDPVLALDFDLAAAARLLELERAAFTEFPPELAAPAPLPGRTRSIDW